MLWLRGFQIWLSSAIRWFSASVSDAPSVGPSDSLLVPVRQLQVLSEPDGEGMKEFSPTVLSGKTARAMESLRPGLNPPWCPVLVIPRWPVTYLSEPPFPHLQTEDDNICLFQRWFKWQRTENPIPNVLITKETLYSITEKSRGRTSGIVWSGIWFYFSAITSAPALASLVCWLHPQAGSHPVVRYPYVRVAPFL